MTRLVHLENIWLQLVWMICISRGSASTSTLDTINEIELPSLADVKLTSVNCIYVVTWGYEKMPSSPLRDVSFVVEYWDIVLVDWQPVKRCNNIQRFRCDISQELEDTGNKECPDFSCTGLLKARVKSCLQSNTKRCGNWVETNEVDLQQDGIISPPDFSIIGLFAEDQLKICNKPHFLPTTNKSLDCYYDSALSYHINYFAKNDKDQAWQEKFPVSFKSKVITLPLLRKPKNGTLMCVQMRIKADYSFVFSEWREVCKYLHVEYTNAEVSEDRMKFFETTDGFLVIVLLVMFFAMVFTCGIFKFCQYFRRSYIEDMKIPNELEKMMTEIDTDQRNQPDYITCNSRTDSIGSASESTEAFDPLQIPSVGIVSENCPTNYEHKNPFHEQYFSNDANRYGSAKENVADERDSLMYVQQEKTCGYASGTASNDMPQNINLSPSLSIVDHSIVTSLCSPAKQNNIRATSWNEVEDAADYVQQEEYHPIKDPASRYGKMFVISDCHASDTDLRRNSSQRHVPIRRSFSNAESRLSRSFPIVPKLSFSISKVVYTSLQTIPDIPDDSFVHKFIPRNSTGTYDATSSSMDDVFRADTRQKEIGTLSEALVNVLPQVNFKSTAREMENPTYSPVNHSIFFNDLNLSKLSERESEIAKEESNICNLKNNPVISPSKNVLSTSVHGKRFLNSQFIAGEFYFFSKQDSEKESLHNLISNSQADESVMTKTQFTHRKRISRPPRSKFCTAHDVPLTPTCAGSHQSHCSHTDSCHCAAHFSPMPPSSRRSRSDSYKSVDSGYPHDCTSFSDESLTPPCSPTDLPLSQARFHLPIQSEGLQKKEAFGSYDTHNSSSYLLMNPTPSLGLSNIKEVSMASSKEDGNQASFVKHWNETNFSEEISSLVENDGDYQDSSNYLKLSTLDLHKTMY